MCKCILSLSFFAFPCLKIRFLAAWSQSADKKFSMYSMRKDWNCTNDIFWLHHLPALYCIQWFQWNPSEPGMRYVCLAELSEQKKTPEVHISYKNILLCNTLLSLSLFIYFFVALVNVNHVENPPSKTTKSRSVSYPFLLWLFLDKNLGEKMLHCDSCDHPSWQVSRWCL